MQGALRNPRSLAPSSRRLARPACVRPALARNARGVQVLASSAAAQNAAATSSWEVHKFGGTCLATADRIRKAADYVMAQERPICVVVSAIGSSTSFPIKVTDVLIRVVRKASLRDATYAKDLETVRDMYAQTATSLLGAGADCDSYLAQLKQDVSNLEAILSAICIAGSSTDSFSDFIIGHGEIWSAKLFSTYCRQRGAKAAYLDARDVLVVSHGSDSGAVDILEDSSRKNLMTWMGGHADSRIMVATGFVARTATGQATTLKRNGSDLSATVFGSLLQSKDITIWTDVDGVYSADPRKVPEAICLSSMTYHEAWELAYFGANVLHPYTTLPAMKYNIPVVIRNFFKLDAPGTRISDDSKSKDTVKGFATIDKVTLISVEGTGMVGIPGIASQIFSTMKAANVNVIMISQASSEQSICFAVSAADGLVALKELQSKFSEALGSGRLSAVNATPNCCVLAAVGDGMVNRKGVAATFLSALAKANINIKAIAQGSSEYNITVLIDQADGERALKAAHSRFYLSRVPIGICVVGPGLVGGTLLSQLHSQAEYLKNNMNIDLRVLGIVDSKKMLLSESGLDLENWKTDFAKKALPLDMDAVQKHMASSYIPNRAMVDCTASEAPAEKYEEWMNHGFHVITPNKKLGSGPLSRYNKIRSLQKEGLIHFFFEATVGAGLPIIGTLQHLVETGDTVVKVEGIFSGTLSYIFNTWKAGTKFSDVVKQAKQLGYTEPDPRDDLSGLDVARKVAILARECGLMLELSDVAIESLVPADLEGVSTAEYMERLTQYDQMMEDKLASAASRGKCLRFVGMVDIENRKGTVGLQEYDLDHPFSQLQGTDNVISFTTTRYFKQPLTIRGPGAGAEVTAAGIFSDILRLSSFLSNPL